MLSVCRRTNPDSASWRRIQWGAAMLQDAQKQKFANPLFEEEIERLREAGKHNDIAYAGALHLCAQEGIAPPPWLVKVLDDLLTELLKRERSSKRGRSSGRVARHRQDLWDFERWCAVDEVRRLRRQTSEDVKRLENEQANIRRQFAHVFKAHEWLRYGTFECASMYLAGTYAWGSPSAVRASYRRVQKRMSSRTAAFRHYLIPGDFLCRVGIPYPLTLLPGNKLTPFYDLTP